MRALAHHELALHSLNLGRFDDVGPHLDEADAWDRDPNAQVFDDDRAQGERLVFRACLRALWHFLRDEGTEAPFVELWEHNDHPFARTYIGLFAAQVHQLLDDAAGCRPVGRAVARIGVRGQPARLRGDGRRRRGVGGGGPPAARSGRAARRRRAPHRTAVGGRRGRA